MHVLFVTSELAGVYKLGGLGDVSGALPVALSKLGVDVTIALPFYRTIDISGVKGVGELAVDFAGKRELVFIFSRQSDHKHVTLLLFRHPRLDDYHTKPTEETFAFFSRVISTFYTYSTRLSKQSFDIVHCHDWHTAVIPLLIGERNKLYPLTETMQSKTARTIVTIHNLLYQGVAREHIMDDLNAPRKLFHILSGKRKGKISLLREGLEYADCISTVSPTYAEEIIKESHHDALGGVLKRRKKSVVGILNGIDTQLWDPMYDAALPHRFDQKSVFTVKPELTKLLRREVGLPEAEVPLFCFIGRIEPRQKGIDIILQALETDLSNLPFQMVVLGTGALNSVSKLRLLARRYAKKLVFINAFDEPLAHRIYAGSDSILVPSKFEPCGLIQMIAMRYGTVPVVRKTGGLADSVKDGMTGVVFEPYSAHALSDAVKKTCLLWADKTRWNRLIGACMSEDFSWDKSARTYFALYRKLKE